MQNDKHFKGVLQYTKNTAEVVAADYLSNMKKLDGHELYESVAEWDSLARMELTDITQEVTSTYHRMLRDVIVGAFNHPMFPQRYPALFKIFAKHVAKTTREWVIEDAELEGGEAQALKALDALDMEKFLKTIDPWNAKRN